MKKAQKQIKQQNRNSIIGNKIKMQEKMLNKLNEENLSGFGTQSVDRRSGVASVKSRQSRLKNEDKTSAILSKHSKKSEVKSRYTAIT